MEDVLKLAIESDPARLAAYSMLGQVYASQRRLGDAKDQFQAMLQRSPKSVSANIMLGMIMEVQRDVAGAEKAYLEALALDPRAWVASNDLAWLYVSDNKNLDKALELAQNAVRVVPNEPNANDTLGWAFYRKGQYTQAVRHLDMSVSKNPSDSGAHYHLGMAYFSAWRVRQSQEIPAEGVVHEPDLRGCRRGQEDARGTGKMKSEKTKARSPIRRAGLGVQDPNVRTSSWRAAARTRRQPGRCRGARGSSAREPQAADSRPSGSSG